MQKVLIVKAPRASFPSEEGLPIELYHVDKLCHGLVTLAISSGQLEDIKNDCICLRPEAAPVDLVYLASTLKNVTRRDLKRNFSLGDEAFWTGEVTKAEINELKKLAPNLTEWEVSSS